MGVVFLYSDVLLRYYDVVKHRDAVPLPVRTHGFDANSQHFCRVAAPHRHNEIELVYARDGDVTLIFAGRPICLASGESAVFWAVVPHFAWECEPGVQLCWVHVPLRQFLSWNLASEFNRRLLAGEILRDPAPMPPAVFCYQLDKWKGYKQSGDSEANRIAMLEVEALFRETAMRVLLHTELIPVTQEAGAVGAIETMLRFVAENYREPITIGDVARAAGVMSAYVMRRFRSSVGTTIASLIADHRIAYAQQQLVSTDASVLDILLDAGFGSVTQFYSLFKRRSGCTPTEYRAGTREPSQPVGAS